MPLTRALIWTVLLPVSAGNAFSLETPTLTDIQQINEDGFGCPTNRYAWSMAVFRDALFVGTMNVKTIFPGMVEFPLGLPLESEGAQIWRYDRDGHWTRVVNAGLGNWRNYGVRNMEVIGDYLYAVTANHEDGFEIWRTADGSTWEKVMVGGSGDPGNTSGRAITSFGGYIYASAENIWAGAEIWRSATGDPNTWEQVVSGGLGDAGNRGFFDFAEFDGKLYAGTLNIGGMQLYRTSNGLDYETVFKNALGEPSNQAVMKLNIFKGRLYLATENLLGGFSLYRTEDGQSFQKVMADGLDSSLNRYLWFMKEYDGRLYAGSFTILQFQFHLFSSPDGENWIVENGDGFGHFGQYGIRCMAVFDGRLILGTATAFCSCKVFSAVRKYTLSVNGAAGSGAYRAGTLVPIQAAAPPGSQFRQWTGDTTQVGDANAPTTSVTMNADITITATFVSDASPGQGPSIAPIIDNIPDVTIRERQAYSESPALTQGSTPVIWSLADGPEEMTVDANTGAVTWENSTSQGSPFKVSIVAINSAGSDVKTWQLTVSPSGPSHWCGIGAAPLLLAGFASLWLVRSLRENPKRRHCRCTPRCPGGHR
jgi:hypothetical protein